MGLEGRRGGIGGCCRVEERVSRVLREIQMVEPSKSRSRGKLGGSE